MSGKYIARHPYHLVDASPWPFYASICAFGATFGGVCYMHDYANGGALLTLSGVKFFYFFYFNKKKISVDFSTLQSQRLFELRYNQNLIKSLHPMYNSC